MQEVKEGSSIYFRQDQVVDGEVVKKISITEEDMEGKDEEFLWNKDKKYFAGFSNRRHIILLYKEDGEKKEEIVVANKLIKNIDAKKWYGWYFLIKKKEYNSLSPRSVLKKNLNNRILRAKGNIIDCPISKDFYRVYLDIDFYASFYNQIMGSESMDFIFVRNEKKTRKLGGLWSGTLKMAGSSDKKFGDGGVYDKKINFNFTCKKVLDVIKELDRAGIEYFEADLSPKQRFMSDHDLFIDSNLRGMFLDLETDDSEYGFENIKDKAILTVGYCNDIGKKPKIHCMIGEKYEYNASTAIKDKVEKKLLVDFVKRLDKYEVLYAWNGFNFDFPILRARFQYHKITYDWKKIIWVDLLAVWRRYFQRGAAVNTSFALDNLGWKVLKKRKLPRHGKKIIQLYTGTEEDRQLLIDYNKRDVEILYGLEEFTGFGKIDQTFCRIGNCFPQDYHISTKIDGLMLKKGRKAGVHFPTRKFNIRSTYEGGFVLEPHIGLHEGVANFDFASLYPTMMTTFNISPETLTTLKGKNIITCPSGASFHQGDPGYIPQMFKHTGEKRKKYTDLQKKEKAGTDMFLLYYRLAYSFKRLGLSFYGELGNNRSRFYNPILAEAVTLSGQHFLKYTMKLAKEMGYQPLYGDTDSMFIKLTREEAKEFETFCNNHYDGHVKKEFNVDEGRCNISLEYENYFDRIFFVTKKKYAGWMKYYKGKEEDFIEVKGLEMMRSDGLEYMRTLQEKVINFILKDQIKFKDLYRFLRKARNVVVNNKLKAEDVMISQAVKKRPSKYKSKLIHATLAQELIDKGGEFYVGMKIQYIITSHKPRLGGMLEEDFVEGKDVYSAIYYWNRKIFPAIERIVEVCYPEENWKGLYVK